MKERNKLFVLLLHLILVCNMSSAEEDFFKHGDEVWPLSYRALQSDCSNEEVKKRLVKCRVFGKKGTPGFAQTTLCQNQAVCYSPCARGYDSERCSIYRAKVEEE